MRTRTASFLGALLLAVACDPQEIMEANGAAAAGLKASSAEPQAAPAYPPAGSCTTDNTDPNYTCKTCTSAGGGVITITCTPKTKLMMW